MCYRNFPHARTETNGYCEGFHSKLKNVCFDKKGNKRLDSLLDVLLYQEGVTYLSRKVKCALNLPIESNSDAIKRRHEKGLKIRDEDVTVTFTADKGLSEGTARIWEVLSQTDGETVFNVTQLSTCCTEDNCFERCINPSCANLCCHLYE